MNPLKFLFVYGVIVTVIAALIFRLKRRKPPSRLKMKAPKPTATVYDENGLKLGDFSDVKNLTTTRELNVVFVYNGHAWDAYEAFGVPAGSPRQKVEEAYQHMVSRVDPESRAFFDAAYKAIMLKNNQSE